MSTRWLRATEVAKIIRAELKRDHPGVKFRVITDSYAGGASIDVYTPEDWTDDQIRELGKHLHTYGGAGFDGMTDSSYPKGHTLCPKHGLRLVYVGGHWGADEHREGPCCERAEPVHSGANYVFTKRIHPYL